MTYRPAPFFANVVLVVSMALLGVIGVLLAGTVGSQQSDALLHLTRADWQVDDAPGFSNPAPLQDSSALPNTWKQVE
ncbi:hypothetical protein, partial [Pseudomonas sp. Pseusp97]